MTDLILVLQLTEMTDVPFIYFNYKKPLPFHVPEAWKRYPFRGEDLLLDHYSTPSSCAENSTWCSDVVWYELYQRFRAHEEALWLFYDNFHFSLKEREGFRMSFLVGGGRVNWGSAVSVNLAFNAIQWFWFRKGLSGVFHRKTNSHRMSLKFTD